MKSPLLDVLERGRFSLPYTEFHAERGALAIYELRRRAPETREEKGYTYINTLRKMRCLHKGVTPEEAEAALDWAASLTGTSWRFREG